MFDKGFYVYILLCSDGSYYVGQTDDMPRRLQEHQNNVFENSYVAQRQPVELIYCKIFESRDVAREFERRIKGWSRKKKQTLIYGGEERLPGFCKRYAADRKAKKIDCCSE